MAEILTEQDQPVLIIGSGSNLLLTGDYPATVIHSSILGIRVIDRQELLNEGWITAADVTAEKTMDSLASQEGKIFVECGSGVVFDDLLHIVLNMVTMVPRICRLFLVRWEPVRCRT